MYLTMGSRESHMMVYLTMDSKQSHDGISHHG
jgi:hypothetical protein